MGFKKLIGTTLLGIRRHSPEILMVAGTVSGVAAVVFAAKDQPKAAAAHEKYKEQMSYIEAAHDVGETAVNEPYSNEDYAKDKLIAKTNLVKDTAKAQKRAIACETISLVCFGGAFKILGSRLAGAIAYGAAMKAGWDEYRDRVRQDQGESKDLEYMTGATKSKTKVTVTDEDGKKHTVTKEVWCLDPNLEGVPWETYSPYAIRITPDHKLWQNNGGNPMLMEAQLKIIQSNLTTYLHMNGSLTLDHALYGQNGLGFNSRDTGFNFDQNIIRNIGWLDTKTEGQDRVVNLGCWDEEGNLKYFPNQCIILDLNCDGWIMGRLPSVPKHGEELVEACRQDPRIEK